MQLLDELCGAIQAVFKIFQVANQSQQFFQNICNIFDESVQMLYSRRYEPSWSDRRGSPRDAIHLGPIYIVRRTPRCLSGAGYMTIMMGNEQDFVQGCEGAFALIVFVMHPSCKAAMDSNHCIQ